MKRSKVLIFISIVLMLLIAAGATVSIPFIYNNMSRAPKVSAETYNEYINSIHKASFTFYNELAESKSGAGISTIDLFFPGLEKDTADYKSLSLVLDSIITNLTNDGYSTGASTVYILQDSTGETISRTSYGNDSLFSYSVQDSSGNIILSNVDNALRVNEDDPYIFHAQISYDDLGSPTISELVSDLSDSWENNFFSTSSTAYIYDELKNYIDISYLNEAMKHFVPPKDFSVVYSVPNYLFEYGSGTIDTREYYARNTFLNTGLFPIIIIIIILVFLLTILCKYTGKVKNAFAEKVYLETVAIIIVLMSLGTTLLVWLGESMALKKLNLGFWGIDLVGMSAIILGGILHFIVLFVLMLVAMNVFFAVFHIKDVGIVSYLSNQVYTIKIIKRFFKWIFRVDLNKKRFRSIFKIVIINFLALFILIAFFNSAGGGLFVYSVALFFVLRWQFKKFYHSYDQILDGTDNMVEGNFEFEFKDNLGLFSPLGENLMQLQNGFKCAVEAETKSQNMKTELITNVSHDLKTPLTAIITYINLLKNKDITEDARSDYISTLERKSNRLKILIEDLFEMSKISSGNIKPDIVRVNLVSLINQLEFELSSEIKESEIEFVVRHHSDSIQLFLDGDMTYRIFENLILNAIKYSLSGSRVYADVYTDETNAIVEIKNTSAEPLDFNLDDITERFVRGDRSRNTDGSGLGLAIAKSFTEVQGGELSVTADGDLFKVAVKFNLPENKPAYSSEDTDLLETPLLLDDNPS